jgi:hypothetical protein
MPCDVRVYDTGYAALSTSVQVIAINSSVATRPNLCTAVQTGTTGFAQLPFSLTQCVYEVSISDSSRTYGHVLIPSLNGNVAGQLEVVLKRLPPPTSGGGAFVTSASQLTGYLAAQGWSDEQQQAVLDVGSAVIVVRRGTGPTYRYLFGLYQYTLEERGISPSAF